MKTINIILSIFCLGIVIIACNSEKEGIVPSTEIVNLTSESNPGSINLTWEYPEGEKNIRYIEVRYHDPRKKKDIVETVSAFSNSITIEDTRAKYGEYKFVLQPFSLDLTPGAFYEISTLSEKAPAVNTFTSKELALKVEDVYVDGIRDSKVENLLDGDLETFVNTDYGKPAGTVFYIDINYPIAQKYLKFSYANRNNAAASFPAKIECYVKANANDEWTLIHTLTKDADGLPITPAGAFVSKEYEAPFDFNYFRFRVPDTHTGKVNFSLAEFRIFEVEHYFYDPEADE